MKNRKKAFTLSELLVVVIVLGVLASVSVPKLSRVLETRKTTEAESMLGAIRTEQEKRCIMGQEYATNTAQVPALAQAGKSKNYSYSLQGGGATAVGGNYSIRMKSYKTGELCCEGDGCAKLNKNYANCSAVAAVTDECAGEVSNPEEPKICSGDSSEQRACGCNNGGTQIRTRTCDTTTGNWSAWSSWSVCSVSSICDCEGNDTETQNCGCENKGTQTRTRMCNTSNGTWGSWSSWSTCSVSDECEYTCDESKPTATRNCGCNNKGTQSMTFTCDTTTGKWVTNGSWSECTEGPCKTCPEGLVLEGEQCCCSGSDEHYVNGTCCSSTTPQSNTACWTTSNGGTMTWQKKSSTTFKLGPWSLDLPSDVKYDSDYTSEAGCLRNVMSFTPSGDYSYTGSGGTACTAAEGATCTSSGATCYVCSGKMMPYKGFTVMEWTAEMRVCLPTTSYAPTWAVGGVKPRCVAL